METGKYGTALTVSVLTSIRATELATSPSPYRVTYSPCAYRRIQMTVKTPVKAIELTTHSYPVGTYDCAVGGLSIGLGSMVCFKSLRDTAHFPEA